MPPIKILHVLGALDPGGVETWLINVLKRLDPQKFQTDFCTFGSHAGLLTPEAEKLGAKVIRCPLHANRRTAGSRFRKILREGRYDVVHSHVHLFSGDVLRWASLEGIPIRIAHSHTSYDEKADHFLRSYYRALMQRWIERYCTHGLAASQIAAEELFSQNWQEDRRYKVLHYGVDLAVFRESFDKIQARNEVGIPHDAPVVGHVGRFVTPKNHGFLLKIAAEILSIRPDVHFLLVGDGPLRAEIQAQSTDLGISNNVHFTGTRSDIPRLMQTCMNAFLFPSLWEGLPSAVMEAQAAGLVCVMSDEITDEVVILPRQIIKLSLTLAPQDWATAIIKSLALGRFESQASSQAMKEIGFSIESSLMSLMNLYSTVGTGMHVTSS
jgi:glycosyltransferase involved in cell wall biosynthesis